MIGSNAFANRFATHGTACLVSPKNDSYDVGGGNWKTNLIFFGESCLWSQEIWGNLGFAGDAA